jgi:hypothetical protein
VAPRLERDDDGEPDHDEREQEVRHDRERVQPEDHGHASQRDLREGSEERAQRNATDPRREPRHPPGREPCRERHEEPRERDQAVAELDERVKVGRRERRVPAAGPVVAAEPGAGEPHERPGGHDEPQRD